MTSRTKKIGFAMGLLALLVGAVWCVLFRSSGFVPPPLPNPNGYDDFVRAGELLAIDPVGFGEEVPLEDLRTVVASNAPALAMLRNGLPKESRVPINYDTKDARAEEARWLDELREAKRLGQALCGESQLAKLEGLHSDSASALLDLIEFGNASMRGGPVIHALVRVALVNIGIQELNPVLDSLDAEQLRAAGARLEKVIEQSETPEEILETESIWSRRTLLHFLKGWVTYAVEDRSLRPFRNLDQKAIQKINQSDQRLSRLLLDVAARAYELEQGHPPGSAAELVPEYLKTVPIDPFTGEPMELAQ